MKVFVASSYSSKVDYETGQVLPEFKEYLEDILTTIEQTGATVFCAARYDGYKINNAEPAKAFSLDTNHIDESDVVLALLDNEVSAGVQTEIGYALGKGKLVILARQPDHNLRYFNAAMVQAGAVKELVLPITVEKFKAIVEEG